MRASHRNAHWIASELRLERRDDSTSWSGRIDGIKVRVDPLPDTSTGNVDGGARIVVTLPRPLQLGCIACTRPNLARLEGTRPVPIGHPRLDELLVFGAAEPEVARAVLRAGASRIAALRGTLLRITDRTIELSETMIRTRAAHFAQQVPAMIALAERLVLERDEWEAPYETRIAPIWSELAAETGMTWDPERMHISGEIAGARVDADIKSDIGLVWARLQARWPSLDRGLELTWPRGTLGSAPAKTLPSAWPEDAPLSFEADHAARTIASSGAAFSLDDHGAMVRVDDVHDERREHRVPMTRAFRALLLLTRELVDPAVGASLYR